MNFLAPIIRELTNSATITFKNEQAGEAEEEDEPDIVIFPVQVEGDKFFIEMEAPADMAVDYELKLFSGEVIHEETFNLIEDVKQTATIEPNGGIPQGILVNEFTYPSGTRNIKTFKY